MASVRKFTRTFLINLKDSWRFEVSPYTLHLCLCDYVKMLKELYLLNIRTIWLVLNLWHLLHVNEKKYWCIQEWQENMLNFMSVKWYVLKSFCFFLSNLALIWCFQPISARMSFLFLVKGLAGKSCPLNCSQRFQMWPNYLCSIIFQLNQVNWLQYFRRTRKNIQNQAIDWTLSKHDK